MKREPEQKRSAAAQPERTDPTLLLTAVELSTYGIWDWQLQTNELYWSQSLLDLLGLTRADFQGDARLDFFGRLHADDRARVESRLQEYYETGRPYEVELRLRHRDGHYVWTTTRGRVFRDERGVPSRLAGVVIDATEEHETRHRLQQTEQRLMALASSLPGAIFQYILRPDGTDAITFMSDGCRDLWEIEPDEAERNPAVLWDCVEPPDAAGLRESVQVSARNLTPWQHTWRIATPSGDCRYLRGYGRPEALADGSVVWNSMVLDETPAKDIEEALERNRALLAQAQKLDAVGQLTGGIAHDFNNLLTVVLNSLELATFDAGRLSERQQRALSDAMAAAERGAELTRSLLSFARQAPLEPATVNLGDAVGQSATLFRRVLPANLSLVVDVHGEGLMASVDRVGFESAVLNLMLNARDAMPEGGCIRVSVFKERQPSSESDGETLEVIAVSVEDEGAGVSAEHAERVFEPFFTTKGNEGSGMGLPMVHGFVTQSGGTIRFLSEPGVGTRVELRFPRSSAVESDGDGLASRGDGSHDQAGNSTRVLLVEDQDSVRETLVELLTSAGYEVVAVCDGESAAELLDERSADFSVVLSDMQMPGRLQGSDLAKQFGAHVPLLLLSGNPPESQVESAAGCLMKPASLSEIRRAIDTAIRRHVRT